MKLACTSDVGGGSRRLSWEHLVNARDLGGLPARDGRTRFGALVRTDSLTRLTPAGQAAMLAHGVTNVVDLRSRRELAAAPSPVRDHAGYRSLPFFDDASMAQPSRYDSAWENYLHWLGTQASRIAAIVRGIAEAPPGGVLVHCVAGKDRTGVVIALVLSVAGVDRDAIAADYALSTWWNEAVPDVESTEELAGTPEAAERARDRRIYYPRPENITGMLAELDRRHGGAEGYLAGIGVGADVRERLRDRLR